MRVRHRARTDWKASRVGMLLVFMIRTPTGLNFCWLTVVELIEKFGAVEDRIWLDGKAIGEKSSSLCQQKQTKAIPITRPWRLIDL
jgi:hypothetical protein